MDKSKKKPKPVAKPAHNKSSSKPRIQESHSRKAGGSSRANPIPTTVTKRNESPRNKTGSSKASTSERGKQKMVKKPASPKSDIATQYSGGPTSIINKKIDKLIVTSNTGRILSSFASNNNYVMKVVEKSLELQNTVSQSSRSSEPNEFRELDHIAEQQLQPMAVAAPAPAIHISTKLSKISDKEKEFRIMTDEKPMNEAFEVKNLKEPIARLLDVKQNESLKTEEAALKFNRFIANTQLSGKSTIVQPVQIKQVIQRSRTALKYKYDKIPNINFNDNLIGDIMPRKNGEPDLIVTPEYERVQERATAILIANTIVDWLVGENLFPHSRIMEERRTAMSPRGKRVDVMYEIAKHVAALRTITDIGAQLEEKTAKNVKNIFRDEDGPIWRRNLPKNERECLEDAFSVIVDAEESDAHIKAQL